jgi:hypothetical protein
MLISKQTDGNTIQSLYDSSNVIASQYNVENKKLVVIFGKGGQYLYEGVDYSDYTKFEVSESQGKSFNTFIKKYPSKQLGIVDTTPIKEDIKNILNQLKSGK